MTCITGGCLIIYRSALLRIRNISDEVVENVKKKPTFFSIFGKLLACMI